MTAAAAAAGAAPKQRRGHEAARRAKRDEALEEGLDDEDNDEDSDGEHDDARERMPEPRMAATVARGNDGLRRTNRLPSKARLMTIVLPTMRNLKTQEAP